MLQRIETKVDHISGHFDQNLLQLQNIILEMQTRLITIDQQIRKIMSSQGYTYVCAQKEVKIKSLEIQMADLQNQLNRKQQEQQQSLYSHPTPKVFDHYRSAPPTSTLSPAIPSLNPPE